MCIKLYFGCPSYMLLCYFLGCRDMAKYIIKGKELTVTVEPEIMLYQVAVGDTVWTMSEHPFVRFTDGEEVAFPKPEEAEYYKTGTVEGVKAVYANFGSYGVILHTKVEIEKFSDDVLFTLWTENEKNSQIDKISFPAPIDFGKCYGDTGENTCNNVPACYTILPRKQGILLPAGVRMKLDAEQTGIVYGPDSVMAMYGQIRRNDGYLAVYDTPYDARYELRYENGGEKVAVLWVPSLGTIRYPRRMRYCFLKDCDYNALAHAYRAYLLQQGNLITLEEKFVRNPKARRILGCPIIHSGIAVHISEESNYYHPDQPEVNDHFVKFETRAEQLKELYKKGVRRAYTHFDGWGRHGYDNLHPEPFPPHEGAGGVEGMRYLADTTANLGFIFGIHDQYRDYYCDAASFSSENAIMNADGTNPYCNKWFGGKHSILCSSVAVDYVKKNYREFEKLGIRIEAAYLDCFSCMPMDECFNPEHPVSREECAVNRRKCLDYLSANGIIPSSEEGIECIIPAMILCHFCSYPMSSIEARHADNVGLPIPLLNLVYHDCFIIPWIGRKNVKGGFGIPEDCSAYALACLNANPLYLSIDADEDEISEITEVCDHAGKYGTMQMTKHEFLSADHRIQRTVFENGITVTVDFDTDSVVWNE